MSEETKFERKVFHEWSDEARALLASSDSYITTIVQEGGPDRYVYHGEYLLPVKPTE